MLCWLRWLSAFQHFLHTKLIHSGRTQDSNTKSSIRRQQIIFSKYNIKEILQTILREFTFISFWPSQLIAFQNVRQEWMERYKCISSDEFFSQTNFSVTVNYLFSLHDFLFSTSYYHHFPFYNLEYLRRCFSLSACQQALFSREVKEKRLNPWA